MSDFVMIHGAWHGGWCWYRVQAALERAGHRVDAPDLASLGRDRTPPETVSLALWADQIAARIAERPEPVILVGHSLGGAVLSEVAERVPERIRTLVYVAAYLLEDGRSVREEAALDEDSRIGAAMVISADRRTASLRTDGLREILYGECSDEDFALARSLLVPQPLAPFATPIRVSATRFGRVPRCYVECARDRTIGLRAQRRMQAATPCARRLTLESDHSPFLSQPMALAGVLADL
ncbi:MAG: alpha/beta fold hydrolase [Gammaproteobacteria bacterium]|nr:alpha/beta fold hydrolase [Gammaproteobacteria bacterium]